MKRQYGLAVLAVVLVLCLIFVSFFVLSLPSNNNQSPSATPTPTPTPTPSPQLTPVPTPKQAPGVTSINFTRWHPSSGKNTIEVAYPANNAVLDNANLSLKIYAASKSVSWAINSIYYTADWLGDGTHHAFSAMNLFTDNIEVTINFHDIPDGYHTFTAYLSVHDYSQANVTVHFTIKTV